MNTAFLAVAAAGLAGLGGLGIQAQTAQVNTPDYTQAAGVFTQWLTPDAPPCVSMSKIGSVSHLTKLTPDQFQFVRALYVAIPPISRELPPGDSAVLASADGKAMVALVAGDKACARFLAPDFVLSMLSKIGKGENVVVGDPI